jgi:hypothetical protein
MLTIIKSPIIGASFRRILSFIRRYGQPAVILSLFDRLGTNPEVIKSLRDSDDAEANFRPKEIVDGTYVDWVNAFYVKYQSDFSAGTDGWVMATADSMAGNIDGIGGENNNFRFTLGTATSSHLTYVAQLVLSELFEISIDVFIPSSNAFANGISIVAGTAGIGTETTLDQWTTITGSAVVTVNNRLGMFVTNNGTTSFTGNGTDVVYIRNVITTQKTANGLVKTVYSQGNSITAQQNANSKMPLLVINGVLQLENGLPIMRRNGADGSIIIDYNVNDSSARTFFYVGKNPSQQFALLGTNNGGSDYGYLGIDGNGGGTNSNLDETNQRLNLSTWAAINREDVYNDLINQFLVVVQCSFNYDNTGLALGFRLTGAAIGMADTQEVIIYENNTDNAAKEAHLYIDYNKDKFIFTVQTDNAGTSNDNQFTIPTTGTGYNYKVETSDGQSIDGNTGDTTITFPTAGTYTVKIIGDFPRIYFNNGGDCLKLLDVSNFGNYALGSTSQEEAFNGCSNMVISASDIGHFENVVSFSQAWFGCESLTSFPLIDTSSGDSYTQTWRGCDLLASFPLINTSNATTFNSTWRGCNSLTSFPLIDTSNINNFGGTWRDCVGLTSFPLIDTSSGTVFNNAWRSCILLTSFPLINTSNASSFNSTWNGCSSLTSFPPIETGNATGFNSTWTDCVLLTSFPLIDTSSGEDFYRTWRSCSSLTSFPLIDTSSATDLGQTWIACFALINFPANAFDSNIASDYDSSFANTLLSKQSIDNILVSIDASGVSNGTFSQSGGSGPSVLGIVAKNSLIEKGWTVTTEGTDAFIMQVQTDNDGTSSTNQFTIPTTGSGYDYDIVTSDGQTITANTGDTTITFPSDGTYYISITGDFPRIYFNSAGDNLKLLDVLNFGIYGLGSTSQERAFYGCQNIVINAIDIGHFENVTDLSIFLYDCYLVTTFPLIDTSSVITMHSAFRNSGLVTMPLLNTANVRTFQETWRDCNDFETMPLIDTSSGESFLRAWQSNFSLTSFPLLDMSSATTFLATWYNCQALEDMPSNLFDSNITTNYNAAFQSTLLSEQSINNLLVSLDTSGVSNGIFGQTGGNTPTGAGITAKNSLIAKGWTVTTT